MKNFKKLIAAVTIVGVLGVTGVAYAVTGTTPSGIAPNVSGKSVEEVTALKAQILDQKKLILDQRVEAGTMTQEQADQIYNSIKANQVNCDATGSAGIGQRNGVGFGQGMGMGMGKGTGTGQHKGGGFGRSGNR